MMFDFISVSTHDVLIHVDVSGVQSVLELGCSYGALLQRANVKCPNVTRYVGVGTELAPLNTTLRYAN
jgi:hypothetical protein